MPKNITLIMPSRLGHTIFCTPTIAMIRKVLPNVSMHVIAVKSISQSILENNPHIDILCLMESDDALRLSQLEDQLLINFNEAAEAKEFVDSFSCEKMKYFVDYDTASHLADRLLNYVAERFRYTPVKEDHKYHIFPKPEHNKISIEGSVPIVGLHMGCHGLAKKRFRLFNKFSHERAWPIQKYISLAEKMVPSCRFLLTGTKEEKQLGDLFVKEIPDTINTIDCLKPLELAALLPECQLFISNDSGVQHLACAMGVKTLGLFGVSHPIDTGPYPLGADHLYIHRDPISQISVEEVYDVAMKEIGTCAVK